jgi:hypothetical protein
MDNMENLLNSLKEQPALAVPISESNKEIFRSSKSLKKGQKEPTHIIIPPSKAIITFNRNVKLFKSVKPGRFKASKVALPKNWTNFDPKVSKYAAYVSKPQNQQKCGSCFAFAVATAMNDVFIFGKKLNFNPDISPLSILSCVKDKTCNLQCDGGDPLGVLDYIKSRGITTNYCMNYADTCNSMPSCYQPVKKAFDEAKSQKTFKSASKPIEIPKCGCCGDSSKFSYYVNQPLLISTTTGINIEGNEDAVQIIKEHLFAYGAAISGYVVYSNFVHDKSNGKFEKTAGIYIESENYCPDPVNVDGKQTKINPYDFMGCHAISIVGWGIEKNPIKLGDGTVLNNTPYWYCRNSWSNKWGLDGYFKMAMYQKVGKKEINKTTAFERINTVIIKNDTYQMGGTIVFTPKKFIEYDKKRDKCDTKSNSYKEPSPKDNKSSTDLASPILKNGIDTSRRSYSKSSNSDSSGSSSSTGSKNKILIYLLFFILLIFISFITLFLYKKYYKKNK